MCPSAYVVCYFILSIPKFSNATQAQALYELRLHNL
jgi:hypothetical protein